MVFVLFTLPLDAFTSIRVHSPSYFKHFLFNTNHFFKRLLGVKLIFFLQQTKKYRDFFINLNIP